MIANKKKKEKAEEKWKWIKKENSKLIKKRIEMNDGNCRKNQKYN